MLRKLTNLLRADSDAGELVRGSSVYAILRAIGLAASYGFHLAVARLYGARSAGVLGLALTMLHVCAMFASLGTRQALVRFVAEYAATGQKAVRAVRRSVLNVTVPSSILAACLLFFSAPWIAARLFHDPPVSTAFRIMSLMLPIGAMMMANIASLRGLRLIPQSAGCDSFVLPVTRVGALLLVALVSHRVAVPVVAHCCGLTAAAVVSYYFWVRAIRNLPAGSLAQAPPSREILVVAWPMLITTFYQYIMGWTDTIMLGMLTDTAEVGIYRTALKVSGLTGISLIAVGSIAGPKFAAIRAEADHSRLIHVVKRAAGLVCVLSFPLIVLEVVYAPRIMLLFGTAFVRGAPTVVLLCAGQAAIALWGLAGILMNMCGAEKAFRNATLIGALINILLNGMLIPRYGINGAAAATALSMTIHQLLAASFTMRILGIWPGVRISDMAMLFRKRHHHA